jgi:hypothetical protein
VEHWLFVTETERRLMIDDHFNIYNDRAFGQTIECFELQVDHLARVRLGEIRLRN